MTINIWTVVGGVSYQLPMEALLGTSNQILGMNTAADALQYKEATYNNTSHQFAVPTSGNVAAPEYTFQGQLTSGLYWDTVNTALGFAIGGTQVVRWANDVMVLTGNLVMNGKLIKECTGANIAAAPTTDLGGATGNVLTVTNAAGATIITSLGGDTLPSGTEIETIISIAAGSVVLTYDANKIQIPGAANLTLTDGDILRWRKTNSASPYWRLVSYQRPNLSLSTRQVITATGAGTYVTPAGCKQIKVRGKAGGGGAAGTADATADASNGGDGGSTTFNGITAAGGKGGVKGTLASAVGGAGGTGGAGVASVRTPGACGGTASAAYVSATNARTVGGFGGGKGGAVANGAQTGIANSGGGGSAATGPSTAFAGVSATQGAGGGGEGEEIEIIINNPAANYAYTVGVGGLLGAAGTNGSAGGAGGSGILVIDEFYS